MSFKTPQNKLPLIELNKNKRTQAAVVFPDVGTAPLPVSAESRLAEAVGLTAAINLDVVYSEIVRLKVIKPSTYIGQGVLDRLTAEIAERRIELLIMDTSLSPIQQRNLEKKLGIKVIDRTALILEIFGERAQTKEGKLQVELAHLTYQRSRLVRSWTHLERQRGGAGFLGGPGETQIELDRRIIDDKILRIKKDLEKVKQTRRIQRSARKRIPYPVVALVGYTNAGKSSLFNRLSSADVLAKDMLFATLDPAMRKIKLPSGREIILSDTVGFISDLPHELIMAFRATLEEVLSADIIVHVRDIANTDTKEQKQDVISVLESLGLSNVEEIDNYIELLNKIDLLSPSERTDLHQRYNNKDNIIPVSAISGEGTDDFLKKIDSLLSAQAKNIRLKISVSDGKQLAWLHQNTEVLSVKTHNDVIDAEVKMDAAPQAKYTALLAEK